MLDKILKIQNFNFRQLPSRKPLPVDTVSKNERIRDYLECARLIPANPPQKLGIETLTAEKTLKKPPLLMKEKVTTMDLSTTKLMSMKELVNYP